MRRVYKFLGFVLVLGVLTGCEKKVEEVNPTETTTTIIEVDKENNENQDTDKNQEDAEEENIEDK
ncbi:hypothetical protein ACF3NF_02450 [Anaerococcus martiniensis]|uniref:hypothetical protein n=1 Tax=Anaerococcus sp. WGS1579 TaxID=3366809 RepID=UPI00372D6F4B